MLANWLTRRRVRPRVNALPQPPRPRLQVESLEDRIVPALTVNDLSSTTNAPTGLTPTQLVQELVGSGVQVVNVGYTGITNSAGTFTGGNGIVGIDSGIILSNGHADAVVGPNNGEDSADFNNGLPGNAELDTLATTNGTTPPTYDATVLSFDFIPQTSTITFNYVFGSDEYNQFVGQFDDVFGFFVNGQNVALIPGTSTPVSINTVNDGNPYNSFPATNSQYYINNAVPGDDPLPASGPLLNTELNGLTTVLPVTAQVNPGVVNHIDLGIEDVSDGNLDSDVFIQAGSFSSGAPISLPPATAQAPYSQSTTVPGGPFTSLSLGSFDPGTTGLTAADVTTNPTNGTFTVAGTPTGAGTVNLAIQGTEDSSGDGVDSASSFTQNYTLAVSPALAISPATLPATTANAAYTQTITVSGGTTPYLNVSTTNFNAGTTGLTASELTVDPTTDAVTLNGTPTGAGTASFTVGVTDSAGATLAQNYVVTVNPALSLSSTTLPPATSGQPYNQTLTVTGGTPSFTTLSVSNFNAGATGLTAADVTTNPANGTVTVSGTPTDVGTATFTLSVTDAAGATLTQTITLPVNPFQGALQSTIGAFDPNTGTWTLRNENSSGNPDAGSFAFGLPNWIPVTGDWNGDGQTTIGVIDPTTMTWYLRNENSAGGADAGSFVFGLPGWIPVTGDWTGSGVTGIGAVDPATDTWYLRNEPSGGAPDAGTFQYGLFGWTPVTGDWTGSGKTGIGAVDPSTMTWYLRNEASAGSPDAGSFQYGAIGQTPITGDWSGKGPTTVGVFDSTNAMWYLRFSNSSGAPDVTPFTYGTAGGFQPSAVLSELIPAGSVPVSGHWTLPTLSMASPGSAQGQTPDGLDASLAALIVDPLTKTS